MDVFTYRLTVKNPKILATEKGDKKFPQLFPYLLFILFFRGKESIRCLDKKMRCDIIL